MKINFDIFKKIEKTSSHIVVVTKYFDTQITKKILEQVQTQKSFLALGENRIKIIQNKNIEREKMHFIGNIQSRKIPEIIKFCNTIHSLYSLRHAELINNFIEQNQNLGIEKLPVFVQINISQEIQKSGVEIKKIDQFLKNLEELSCIEIIGISAIGAAKFTVTEKIKEFQALKKIRDKYLPGKKISAGTSRDYEIALKEGIEIVRVGNAIFE